MIDLESVLPSQQMENVLQLVPGSMMEQVLMRVMSGCMIGMGMPGYKQEGILRAK